MKTSLLLIALMFSTSAFGRIGETMEEIQKRYGRPVETIREKGEGRRYSFRDYNVVVGFDRGISQCEIYQRKDNTRMTEPEIRGLLQANAGKSEWNQEPDEGLERFVYWSRDRKTRVAIYALATHDLMVTSKAFLRQFAHLLDSSDRKKMDGF